MKHLLKYTYALVLLAAPMCVQASRSVYDLEECSQIIPLREVTSEISRQLSWGQIPNVAIAIEEGTEFPVGLFAKFDFYSLIQDPTLRVVADRACFFRVLSKGPHKIQVYMSFDLHKWKKSKPIPRGAALLDISGGAVRATLHDSALE